MQSAKAWSFGRALYSDIREFKIPVPVVTGTAKCHNDVISSQAHK